MLLLRRMKLIVICMLILPLEGFIVQAPSKKFGISRPQMSQIAEPPQQNLEELIQRGVQKAEYPQGKYNLLIVSTMLATAVTAVLFRDVWAISSLYINNNAMEADWLPESFKLLARLPSDCYVDYGNAALAHPIWIKAWTSAVSYLIGDTIAQVYEGRRRVESLDLSRSFRNAASGFLLHGPILHYWIAFLEKDVTAAALSILQLKAIPPNSSIEYGLIAGKIALDQTVFAFGFNTVYTIGIGILALKSIEQVTDSLQSTLIPSILASWKFWPIVHILTYSPVIPEQYKLLWVDFAEILWVAILSFLSNAERVDTSNDTSKAMIVEEFDVQPAVEILLARYVEKHGFDHCVDPNAVDLCDIDAIELNDPILANRLRESSSSSSD